MVKATRKLFKMLLAIKHWFSKKEITLETFWAVIFVVLDKS